MEKSLSLDRAFQDVPFDERFALASAAGFKFVEIAAWMDLDITRAAEGMKKHGLRLAALLGSNGHDLSKPETHGQFSEHLSQSIAVAKLFECTRLIIEINTGGGQETPAEASDTAVIAREDLKNAAIATRILMAAAQRAERIGMTFYLSPPRSDIQKYGYLSVLRLHGNVISAVNSPAMKLLLDSAALWKHGDQPEALGVMRRVHPHLGYVHLGDGTARENWAAELAWFKKTLVSFYNFDGVASLLYPATGADQDIMDDFTKL